jgi:hypothetical protein
MKHFGSKVLGMCALMIMLAAMLAPAVVKAEDPGSCPTVTVECSGGRIKSCNGTSDGAGHCVYSESCMTCGPGLED